MTLKITPAQFAAPRAVIRSLLAVCAAMALAVALGCGGGNDSQTPILAGAGYAVIVDVPALLESSEIPPMVERWGYGLPSVSRFDDPAEWKEELRDDFEDAGLEPADSISVSASVHISSTSYAYTAGGLDFAAYREKLDDDGLEDGGYRGFEIWGGGYTASAILEDREIVVSGNEETVKDVIKAFDRGEGFVDESSPLKRALDKTGGGLVSSASENCGNAFFRYSASACRAAAESVKGGDAGKSEIFGVYLFSSERRAQSSLDDIEDLLYESGADADFEEIKADGEFVTYRATIYAP